MMNRLIVLITICFFSNQFSAQTVESNWLQPNGEVRAIIKDSVNDVVYIGGDFSFVGANEPFGTQINALTAEVSFQVANPNGAVLTSVSDGIGGWYIGGSFTQVGDSARNNVAHINQFGEVTPWNPNPNGGVNSIVVYGSKVFLGGDFTSVGLVGRPYFAAINASSGLLLPWVLELNSAVSVMKVKDNYLYLGGLFTNIDGQSRNCLAQVDLLIELVTSWNPAPNSNVKSLEVSGTSVYVGGYFSTIGGQSRSKIASVDLVTGIATSWNPVSNGVVDVILISGNIAYVGGSFTSLGGQSRNNIAAIDLVTGLATSWNPSVVNTDASCFVSTLGIIGQRLFIGGQFDSVGMQQRVNLAAIDISSGSVDIWKPNASDYIRTLSIYNSEIYVGGDFISISGESRNNLAALDPISGQLRPWNPNANGPVSTLLLSEDLIYIGGAFTTIGVQNRNYLAALDTITGNVTTWNPNADSEVKTLSLNNNKLYVGGYFSHVGGQNRQFIAALDINTGAATSWNPVINNGLIVSSVVATEEVVYIGGAFSTVGGLTRNNIAALDGVTGVPTSWNPNSVGEVFSMLAIDSILYVGGTFFSVSGQPSIGGYPRSRIAALHLSTGLANEWDPNPNGWVRALATSGNKIYVVGDFSMIGGVQRRNGAEIDRITASIEDWNPHTNGTNFTIALDQTNVYLGGIFTEVEGNQRYNFAVFNKNSLSYSLDVNTFVAPSPVDSCVGLVAVTTIGNPNFVLDIDNSSVVQISSGYSTVNDLCVGVHSLFIMDDNNDTLTTIFVIPVDSNYIFNNPFIDSIAVDSLGATIEDCDIYYNGIDTAFIDSIFANGNTVTVVWNIVDSNGSNFDTSTYVLNNGNGVYYLQLSVFCPTKALGEYFTVTEAVYLEGGYLSIDDPIQSENLFELFPNPTNDLVTIRFDFPKADLVMYDAQGKRIQTQTINSGDSISLATVQTGVYFFELTTEQGKTVKRVVKQ